MSEEVERGVSNQRPAGRLRGLPLLAIAGLAVLGLLASAPTASAISEPWTSDIRMTNDTLGSFSPAIAIDARDTLRVVWVGAEVQTTEDPSKMITVTTYGNGNLFALSLDNHGNRLHEPAQISDLVGGDYHVDEPSVAVDSRGHLHVVWSDDRAGQYAVSYIELDQDDRPLRTLTVSAPTGHAARFPDVAVDSLWNVHIMWADWREGSLPEVYYEKYAPDGTVLVDNMKITHSVKIQAASHPTVAADPADNLHVVWEQDVGFTGTDEDLMYSVLDRNATFVLKDVRLNSQPEFQGRPDMAMGADGIPRLVWEDDSGTGTTVRFRTLAPGNTRLDNGKKVIVCAVGCVDPRVAVDPSGVSTITWSMLESVLVDNAHVHAAQLDATGEFLPALRDRLLDRSALIAQYPEVALDSLGNPIIAWADERSQEQGATPTWDLYYARTAGGGVNTAPVPVLVVRPASPSATERVVLEASNSSDPDGWDSLASYRYTFGDGNGTGWIGAPNTTTSYARPGTYLIRLEVRDRFGLESNATFPITVRLRPGSDSGFAEFPTWAPAAVITISIGGLAVGGVASTEVGKYGLLTVFNVLYSRIRRENTLDNYVRGQIHGFIMARPGVHYNHIKQTLNLNNGTLAYHLRKLEKEEFIKAQRDGMYKRFYPVHMKVPGRVVQLTEMQRRIRELIAERPGISQKEVAAEVSISAPAVIYHIGILVGAGKVRREKDGPKSRYYPVREDEFPAPWPGETIGPTAPHG